MTQNRETWQVPENRVERWTGRRHEHCVVIPVINEGDRIASLLRRMSALAIPEIADVIIVDGGSTDGSLGPELLEETGVAGLIVKTGPGKLSAQLRCAYAFALDQSYDGVVTIDGNDKDDPAPIAAFIEAMESGADFVQASRFVAGGVSVNTPGFAAWRSGWSTRPSSRSPPSTGGPTRPRGSARIGARCCATRGWLRSATSSSPTSSSPT